ncbi:MAG TPA: DUF2207 domain-containing protein [Verrucomicrobiae bacterium]|nr:DUF2207 domain-containing protein [Verrucomicrobiae bacterium]
MPSIRRPSNSRLRSSLPGAKRPAPWRATFAAAFIVLLLGICLAASPASARQLVIRDFTAQVTVNTNGTIEVTEVIEAQFTGKWNGIYRTIPVQYTGPAGLNYDLLLVPVSATDDAGNSLKYQQSRQGRSVQFKIWVPGAEDATRTIIFRYRVRNAIRFFPDHDELYWNVTGNQWDVPIEAASAHIELPPGVTGLRATAYTGTFGSREQNAQVTVRGNSVEVVSSQPLVFHEGLTAVAGWDKGFVHQPSVLSNILFYLFSNWPLFLPLPAFAIMFWLWWTRGRDPERDVITVQYDPPDNLSPGECGTLVDDEASMRDITATLVDLAVKGYLTIEQKDESKMLGLMHDKDYVFHLKKSPAEWASARPHEQKMLSALFDAGANTDVTLSSLQNQFYRNLPAIRDRIFDALVTDGYYLHRPDTVRQGYVGGGILIGVMIVFVGNWLSNFLHTSQSAWFVSGILTAAVICVFGYFMPARTISGAKAYAKVLGFEDFLSRVEKDRIARMENAPQLFEKFLPYAMALHVEKKWVQAFQGIAMQPPQWFQGAYAGPFQAYLLVADLNIMSSMAGTTLASAPRSVGAGGSGFGGGGMSGGGFGGGGGGGF